MRISSAVVRRRAIPRDTQRPETSAARSYGGDRSRDVSSSAGGSLPRSALRIPHQPSGQRDPGQATDRPPGEQPAPSERPPRAELQRPEHHPSQPSGQRHPGQAAKRPSGRRANSPPHRSAHGARSFNDPNTILPNPAGKETPPKRPTGRRANSPPHRNAHGARSLNDPNTILPNPAGKETPPKRPSGRRANSPPHRSAHGA
jgi:hypothetical protein